MKKICFFLICLSSSMIYSQTYKLLNDIVNNDETYIKKEFEVFDKESFVKRYLTDSFFKNNWEPLPSKNTPDINLFLNNFSFNHIKADALNSINSELIDFDKLNKYYLKVEDIDSHLDNKKSFLVTSKPIFNCSKNWSFVYRYAVFKDDVGNSGYLFIYRKINNKWTYYHKINVWVS